MNQHSIMNSHITDLQNKLHAEGERTMELKEGILALRTGKVTLNEDLEAFRSVNFSLNYKIDVT
jgi:hypothetical protein